MSDIKLHVPAKNQHQATAGQSIEDLRRFIDNLPLANSKESGRMLLARLNMLNRAPLDVQSRYRLLAVILPTITRIVRPLRDTYIASPLPLGHKQQETADLVFQLLTEMSYGYKTVVLDLAQELSNIGKPNWQVIAQPIYCAIDYLGCLLAECYSLYRAEPQHIWLELNQLYLFAEQKTLHNIELKALDSEHEPEQTTIANQYKRSLVLALANPYHLMQGEANKIFFGLKDHMRCCKLMKMGEEVPKGHLFIDLAMDMPPLYTPTISSSVKPTEGRLLDLSNLIHTMRASLEPVVADGKTIIQQNSLGHRMERDAKLRWVDAWGTRRERGSHREAKDAPTTLLSGLTDIHYFLNGCQAFTPEQDEQSLLSASRKSGLDSLSLIPEEHQPWLHEQDEDPFAAPASQSRSSTFHSSHADHEKEMWHKVFTNASFSTDDPQQEAERTPHGCTIVDANQGGFGLQCSFDSKFPARVGELLASQSAENADSWAIGSVRWMRIPGGSNIELGVRIIAEDARALAGRAVRGIGKGSEYSRCLLVPNLDPKEHPTTLITPAAVYDVDSVIMLLLDEEIIHVQLTRQLESSSAFARFQFTIVKAPQQADERADLPNERLSNRLYK